MNCDACNSIREIDPNLVMNGFGDDECASFKNNTGLVPNSGNNNETDLNNLNDCMIGNFSTELVKYDVCDWKAFMEKYMPNEYTLNKALICAIAGLWERVEELERR